MSLDSLFQKAMANPAVKKLRALEQSRVARVTQRQAVRRERLVQTLRHVDVAAKDAVLAKVQERADDLKALADDLAAALAPSSEDAE
jgi:hypothetical protein